jgi:hypothetical protein
MSRGCGVGRGTSSRVALVPLSAIGSTLLTVTATSVFGWFVSWISSVVILELCFSELCTLKGGAGESHTGAPVSLPGGSY